MFLIKTCYENNDVKKILKDILKTIVTDEKFKKKIEEADKLDFIEDLEFDSLDIMEMVAKIEERFDIDMSYSGDVTDVICSLEKLTEWIIKRGCASRQPEKREI